MQRIGLLHTISLLIFCEYLSPVYSQASKKGCHKDICFVVDHSGSIRDNNVAGERDNWELVIEFIKSVVDENLVISPEVDQVAAVSFGNRATLNFNLKAHPTPNSLTTAIEEIPYGGGNTNTTGGLRLMRTSVFTPAGGDRSDIPNVCILITDGVPTREVEILMDEVNAIKSLNVTIFAVAVTKLTNETLLRMLVSEPIDKHYFAVNDFSHLRDSVHLLASATCTDEDPRPTSATTTNTAVEFTPSDAPTLTPTVGCRFGADVFFLLDDSLRIDYRDFVTIRDFVADLTVGQGVMDKIRLGVLALGDRVHPRISLGEYGSRTEAQQAIKALRYSQGPKNTAAALEYARLALLQQSAKISPVNRFVVLIVKNGVSMDKRKTMFEAELMRRSGIHIIVLAVGSWFDWNELRSIPNFPHQQNLIAVPTSSTLRNISQQLIDLMCNNLDECSENSCVSGSSCTDLLGDYQCSCPTGYSGRNCERSCPAGADVVFLLDTSWSIGMDNFQTMLDFVSDIILNLNTQIDSRVGLVTFADTASVQLYLNSTNSTHLLLNSIASLYTGGSTNTSDALRLLTDEVFTMRFGDRPSHQNVAILVTDGMSNDPEATFSEAVRARSAGSTLLVVGIGGAVSAAELEGIASYPTDSNSFLLTTFPELDSVAEVLSRSLCNVENDCEPNPCQHGGQCLNLINGFRCSCQYTTTGRYCERKCRGLVDVAFVIDSSGSVRRERFHKILEFIADVISELEVSPSKTRIGLISFSDNATVQFHLDKYGESNDVIQAVKRTPYVGGKTNIASALKLLVSSVFVSGNGDRAEAPDVAILFTDGVSTIDSSQTLSRAVEARSRGIYVVTVGVGSMYRGWELEAIASQPASENVLSIDSWTQLPTIKPLLLSAACPVSGACESVPCRNGGRCVQTFKKPLCLCNAGSSGRFCEKRCSRQMDVVFVVDFSGSTDERYRDTIAFIREAIEMLPIGVLARVAVVSFATEPVIHFYLNTYSSVQDVLDALTFVPVGGRTNTQAALRLVYESVLTSAQGDRSGVSNIVVLVSDGYSNVQRERTIPEAQQLHSLGTTVYAVAIGENPDMNEILGIASEVKTDHVFAVPSSLNITDVASQLIEVLCRE